LVSFRRLLTEGREADRKSTPTELRKIVGLEWEAKAPRVTRHESFEPH
jgi:hypothetical protein